MFSSYRVSTLVFCVIKKTKIEHVVKCVSVHPGAVVLQVNPSAGSIQSGTSITLTCTSKTTAHISYTFLHNNKPVSSSSVRGNKLTLSHSKTTDSGAYLCFTTVNGVKSNNSNVIQVKVVGELQSFYLLLTKPCRDQSIHIYLFEI